MKSTLLKLMFFSLAATFFQSCQEKTQKNSNEVAELKKQLEKANDLIKEYQDSSRIIPLNKKDPTLDIWNTFRDDLQKGRDPGLINIQRFYGGTQPMAMPTFFQAPIALTPEDLKAGDADVAIFGGLTDMSSGFRGASSAPNVIRSNTYEYVPWGSFGASHMETMVNPLTELTIADYGNAPVDPLSTERSVHAIRDFVKQVASVTRKDGTHVIPIIVGGDHALMYPDVAGLVDVYGKGNVGVIHFDSHYDASKNMMGHLISHGQPVYRLISEGLVPGKNFIQIGLHGYYPDKESFEWMREQGFRYHTMNEIDKRGWDAVLEDAIQEAKDGPKYLFVSFDIDVIDPSFTPGTGTPEPGGITNRQAFNIVRRLCAESNVVGFELVEFLPYKDPGYTTALNCNRILREALTGMAMRKKGITSKNYRSELTEDDGI
ncbi:agmatinase family protein [Flavicella marina]|uniref:agmatinase family protein n=1 Tax=Flavicella marina TaxID=1475951 RepID=UPI001D032146|nr:agmatinase family protein [Flavicella marina]